MDQLDELAEAFDWIEAEHRLVEAGSIARDACEALGEPFSAYLFMTAYVSGFFVAHSEEEREAMWVKLREVGVLVRVVEALSS